MLPPRLPIQGVAQAWREHGVPEQARRHHVVSKFYLRYFADDRDQVQTVVHPGDRTFRQNITNATVQTDFYTVVDEDGEQSDAAERSFSELEGLAATAWQEMANGVWPLPDEHRAAMAGWLALQLLRGTSTRNSMSEIWSHGLLLEVIVGGRNRLREALQAEGLPDSDEDVNLAWVNLFKEPLRFDIHPNIHMRQLGEMLPEYIDLLLARSWVLTVFKHKALATSDHPVYVVPNDEMTAMGMGTGVINATVIHAPLTRRHSLAMYLPHAVPQELRVLGPDHCLSGVAAVALYSNSCAARSARRFLFHHPDDTPLAGVDLPQPRQRESMISGRPWGWMAEDDQQVLLDAGFGPDDLDALLG